MPPGLLQREVHKKTPFDSHRQEAYLNLLRTHDVLSARFDELFQRHGLSQPQYNALRIVAAAGRDGIPSQTIGEHLVARSPDVTKLVDRLEHAGLVARERSDADRRCVLVSATAEGRALLRRLRPKVSALHSAQMPGLSESQVRQLIALLERARTPGEDVER